ncbi:hypothetical protein BC351_10610 [Paenibacillus ferrarius]|uniref:Uncharacterized protein n=1 Tax=Paenibacillus ferrarius TaxID=1469647 RepID=A0A1V4H9I3_9BACL|nr:hypothetical protein [Paenibacillus ferrarius]OPH47632.1 hypothetical protein BC351_10610 [Paenibacillus ferrarius]
MINTPKRLYVGQPTTAATTLYTVPANTTTIVKNILITNTTATSSNITIYAVPNSQTVGNQHKILAAYTVKGNDTISMDVSLVVSSNDTIQALQGTSAAISIYVSGVEIV